MNRRSDTPREGTKLAWLAQHADWTIEQLLSEGPFANDSDALKRARFVLKSKYGVQTAALPTGRAGARIKAQAETKTTKKSTTKKSTTKKSTTKKTKRDDEQSPAVAMKQAQLRRLIFEMGWDAAREVFHEFDEQHAKWRG